VKKKLSEASGRRTARRGQLERSSDATLIQGHLDDEQLACSTDVSVTRLAGETRNGHRLAKPIK
jgi:hypothetical protein